MDILHDKTKKLKTWLCNIQKIEIAKINEDVIIFYKAIFIDIIQSFVLNLLKIQISQLSIRHIRKLFKSFKTCLKLRKNIKLRTF